LRDIFLGMLQQLQEAN